MMTLSGDAIHWLVFPAAIVMDLLVGDPRKLPHPIRWMGSCIQILEPHFRSVLKNDYLAGTLFALVLIVTWWGLTAVVVRMAQLLHPMAGFGVEVVLIFFCLSARSLYDAAMEIYALLMAGRTDAARAALAMIVGRDVTQYGANDIARATVETVAENFVDGVLSPLFFAIIGGAPLAIAYKMTNTLDSMVGYKNARYHQFGRTAARIDDMANFIPARISVLVIALAARFIGCQKGSRAMYTALKEGSHHSSPNAGYPEAAFAGALGVKLNGPNDYGGVRVDKPYIGIALGDVRVSHIARACELFTISVWGSYAAAWVAWCV